MRVVEDAGELTEKSGDIEFQWIVKDVQSILKGDICCMSRLSYVADNKFVVVARAANFKKHGRLFCVFVQVEDCMSSKSFHMTVSVKIADGTELYNEEFSKITKSGIIEGIRLHASELGSVEVLTVTCVLRVKEEIHSTTRFDTLSDELSDLFLSQVATDVKLVVNQEEIPAHKSILSARSPVFASMFKVDMKEKMTGVVHIQDIPTEPFRDFLLYLYSGKIKDLSRNTIDLYKIADKYDVPQLKEACVRSLRSSLSLDNMFDALLFADFFNERKLKSDIQKFFNETSNEIFHGSKWKSVFKQNFDLCNDLLKGMSKKA